MKLKLSIVIPFYKEGVLEIFPLLSSIATQKGVDFAEIEVILVNDGHGGGDFSALALFPQLTVTLVEMEDNRGPGVARQVGLDYAQGEYVMFCDCDDLLHNVGVLSPMLQEIAVHNADYLSTSWVEEVKTEDGSMVFVTHEIESTWLHGKMFRREFILQESLRFHEDLRVHEDSYFLSVLCELTDKRIHLPITSYVWTHSPDSITRNNDGIYSFESMDVFCYAVTESIKEVRRRMPERNLSFKVLQLLCYIYLIAQSKLWREEKNALYLQRMRASLQENMLDLWDIWESAEEDFIASVYWDEFSKSRRDMVEVPFMQWVSDLREVS